MALIDLFCKDKLRDYLTRVCQLTTIPYTIRLPTNQLNYSYNKIKVERNVESTLFSMSVS